MLEQSKAYRDMTIAQLAGLFDKFVRERQETLKGQGFSYKLDPYPYISVAHHRVSCQSPNGIKKCVDIAYVFSQGEVAVIAQSWPELEPALKVGEFVNDFFDYIEANKPKEPFHWLKVEQHAA